MRRSAWDVVRRKRRPSSGQPACAPRYAWTSKIDANKIDLAQVAAAIDGFNNPWRAVWRCGQVYCRCDGRCGGRSTSKVAPHREVQLSAQFEELCLLL